MDYDNVWEDIREAAKDVLTPLIDVGTFTGSQNDVGELARKIASRSWELIAARLDKDV